MANKQRGEVTVSLSKKNYTLRPTFEAICEIEDRLGKTIPEVIMEFDGGKISMNTVAVIVHEGMRAYNENCPNFSEVGNMIRRHGLINLLNPGDGSLPAVAEFLRNGILGDQTEEEVLASEKKPANKTQKS